ncbi:MAG: T9SS type A sorting domain-containing protein [bacterium]|nr:T9SS type A sorting domain-containing protein [bacterium]
MGIDKVYMFYLDSEGSGLNTKTMGFACDTSGAFLWPGDFVTLSNPTQEKLQMETAMDVYKNCKLVWGDRRLDTQGIYAQDINPLGQLGQPIIPVEFVSFTATVQRADVLLNWITSTETNNRGFEILRSCLAGRQVAQNDNEWQSIGFVSGSGTTTEIKVYSFTDQNVSSGKVQYRLQQIDFDGSSNYSNSIEVEVTAADDFVLFQNYPNPFNPVTVISYQLPVSSFVTLKIYDVLGKEVVTLVNEEQSAGRFEMEFNANNLPSGVYLYELKAGSYVEVKNMILLK